NHLDLHSFPTRRSSDLYFDFDNGIDSMTQQNALNDTPIVNYLKQYFNDQQWHYNHYRPKSSGSDNNDSQQSHYLSFRMRNKNLRSEEHTSELQSRENLV